MTYTKPLLYMYLYFMILNSTLNVHIRRKEKKNYLSFMYIKYTNAINNTPSTLTLVHTWYEESTPQVL